MPDTAALSEPARQWRAATLLAWPLALAAAPLVLKFGDVPLCLFRQLSGRPCPLCGGTHACAALVEGNLSAAWQANPGVLLLLTVAATHSIKLACEARAGRSLGGDAVLKQAWLAAGALLLATWGLRLAGYL